MKAYWSLPDATLFLERNGEVQRAQVQAVFNGDKYQIHVNDACVGPNGTYRGILHWRFPEGVFTQEVEVKIQNAETIGTPVGPIRRFQRRRERRFEAAFPVQFLFLNGENIVSCEGVTRDLSRRGLCARVMGSEVSIRRGMFVEFRVLLRDGTVEGVGRVVEVHGVSPAGMLIRCRVSGMTENGAAILEKWLAEKKKEVAG